MTARQRCWPASISLNASPNPVTREPGPRVGFVQCSGGHQLRQGRRDSARRARALPARADADLLAARRDPGHRRSLSGCDTATPLDMASGPVRHDLDVHQLRGWLAFCPDPRTCTAPRPTGRPRELTVHTDAHPGVGGVEAGRTGDVVAAPTGSWPRAWRDPRRGRPQMWLLGSPTIRVGWVLTRTNASVSRPSAGSAPRSSGSTPTRAPTKSRSPRPST